MKECKLFISRRLDHPWPLLQPALNVELANKGHAQISREFTPIPYAELALVQSGLKIQVVCMEVETEHGLFYSKTLTKAQY